MQNISQQSISIGQPGSRFCFVCGVENPIGLHLRFYETSPGEVTANYTAPEHYQGYPGVLHGGIVAAILDETSGRALMGDPAAPRFMFTGKLEVRYRKNVPVGKPLKVIGRAGKARSKVAVGWAGIYDERGILLAEANTLLIDVPQSVLDSADLEKLGWKVYPEPYPP